MRVLVVAAHPDDEVLGCGGVMARHTEAGDEVHVLIMAEGGKSRSGVNDDYCHQLKNDTREVSRILGIKSYSFARYPDQQMDTKPILQITQCIESHVQRLQPSIVYTHWPGDLDRDHRITAEAVLTACRPQPGAPVHTIYAFEIPSSTGWGEQQFQPNTYAEINWKHKEQALEAYGSEMRHFPHARSYGGCEALARVRGSMVGLPYAEAFRLVRRVIA